MRGGSTIPGGRSGVVPRGVAAVGDEAIMSIAGHVSLAMLSRYSHVRMEAKRRTLDEVAARQNPADENGRKEAVLQ